MYRKAVFFAFILLFAAPLTSQATVVSKMYEVSLPVVSQEVPIRRAAFEQAFIQVLVRVSGSSLASTSIDLRMAPKFVQQYRYLSLDPAQNVNKDVLPGMPVAKHNLWVQFNEGSIKKLLREKGLPIWGRQRPTVLMWIAVRDGKNRYILREQDQSTIKDALTQEAERRGLPVIWPRFDKQDQAIASFPDVWGSFWDPVVRASKNYPVDAVMIGRMNWKGGSWQVDWSLMLDGKSDSWRLKALDLQLLMASGVDVATDQIASRFSVLEDVTNEGEIVVQVNGVQQLHSYAGTERYLRSLAPVKNVFATEVAADFVRFHVDVTGNKDDLRRIIALGKTLAPDEPPKPQLPVNLQNPQLPVPALPSNVLTYKYRR